GGLAGWPGSVSEGTREGAVALWSPVTEPAPAVCEKTTTVELSLVTTLLLASSTAAVNVLVEPEATLAAPDVNTSLVAVPGVTENDQKSVVQGERGAVTGTDCAACPCAD